MEKINKQHIQLPNDMTKGGDLEPRDLLIYVCIKKYMNKITKECFPSLKLIAEISGISIPTIRKTIEKLKVLEYVSVRKEGRKNVYKFNPYRNFEPFSYAFLEKNDLNTNEKAYIIASQQHMFKNIEGYGKISYTDAELADKLNISYKSITRYNKSLMDKGYLDIVKTNAKDEETGLKINEKLFHLNELEQAIVFTLQNHEDRLEKTEDEIDAIKRQMEILMRENSALKKQMNYEETEVEL